MPKFLIERDIPGAGNFTPEQLTAISESSCRTLRGIDTEVKWLTSFVTADKIYCIYIAPDEESSAATPSRAASPPTSSPASTPSSTETTRTPDPPHTRRLPRIRVIPRPIPQLILIL